MWVVCRSNRESLGESVARDPPSGKRAISPVAVSSRLTDTMCSIAPNAPRFDAVADRDVVESGVTERPMTLVFGTLRPIHRFSMCGANQVESG